MFAFFFPETIIDLPPHLTNITTMPGISPVHTVDGRKHAPISHGATTDATFLSDAAAICKQFMDRNPGSLEFSLTALAGN